MENPGAKYLATVRFRQALKFMVRYPYKVEGVYIWFVCEADILCSQVYRCILLPFRRISKTMRLTIFHAVTSEMSIHVSVLIWESRGPSIAQW
jgi:hypothetical protein